MVDPCFRPVTLARECRPPKRIDTRAASYARMSTDRQSADSPEDQIRRCREFAADRGWQVVDALDMFYHVANIGDARSLAIHPATTTHSQMSSAEQRQTGVTDSYVRLSVGIEHIDDILADLDNALPAVGMMVTAA